MEDEKKDKWKREIDLREVFAFFIISAVVLIWIGSWLWRMYNV